MEITNETRKFITDHATVDVHKLAFKSALYPLVDIKFAVRQIFGKQCIKNKIPSFFSNENIVYPPKISLEQTSSEATALYKASLCSGKSFIDLTGGFGCDCYFISRNFEQATFVEQNSELCEHASMNFNVLNANNINVVCAKAEDFLSELNSKVDFIYLDPARRSISGNKTVLISDCTPNVNDLAEMLVAKSSKVLIKLSPLIDISLAVKELKYVSEVHVVSVENECKEVLFVLSGKQIDEVRIFTENIRKNKESQHYTFVMSEEGRTEVTFATTILEYIYEPNSSIMKAGAFKSISAYYNLQKLDVNTHLYTSDKIIETFPGRIFKVENQYLFSKSGIKDLKSKISKVNITTRNFPLSVNEIRKKTALSEGGDKYIFASVFKNEKLLILCRKVV